MLSPPPQNLGDTNLVEKPPHPNNNRSLEISEVGARQVQNKTDIRAEIQDHPLQLQENLPKELLPKVLTEGH
ncbi:hypothetical protein DSO57_1008619 [Entomophthora muscae]|uniref:Uncharacterized protein n=1 Tax=Entomophthora muscae TaxID=34485 RepID=A0ACC2RYC1_9FUNG|nr:hypothetical protein DSO57_1008619 [Entomophthora muscae]